MKNCGTPSDCSPNDLTGRKAAWYLWYLPIALLLVGLFWTRGGRVWVWVPALVVMGRLFFSLLKAAFLFVRKRGGKWEEKSPPLRSDTASRSLQQLGKLALHEAHLFVRHSLVQDIP